MSLRRITTGLIVLLFITLFAVITVTSSVRESATFDETTHLISGYSYLKWNDYRMNPEHPPLLKKWAALPLLGLHLWPDRVTPAPGPDASGAQGALQGAWALGLANNDMQWFFSHYVLHGVRDETLRREGVVQPLQLPTTAHLKSSDFHNNADQILFWGRLPMAILGALLAFIVFLWSRELFGLAGGLISLSLFCFDPNFVAHAGLVTTDVGMSLFALGAMYFLWKACHTAHDDLARSRWSREARMSVGLTSLFVGLAMASKYTAVLLIPMILVVLIVWTFSSDRSLRLKRSAQSAGIMIAVGVTSWILVWGAYGFRYSAATNPVLAAQMEQRAAHSGKITLPSNREPGHFPLDATIQRSAVMKSVMQSQTPGVPEEIIQQMMPAASIPLTGRLMLLARDLHLVPEGFLYGFAFAEMKSQARSSSLLGHLSQTGWWYYFPVAFLLKTPPITLLTMLAALCLLVFRRTIPLLAGTTLLAPVLVFLAAALSSNLNIGHRHILPIYPFLFVFCGSLGPLWAHITPRFRVAVAGVALLLLVLNTQIVFSLSARPTVVYPDYLAYFNEFAGGPRHGAEALVDSNLDWGQGLKELKEWMNQHPTREPVYLSYFGTADPRYYQISCLNMPGGYFFAPAVPMDKMTFPAYFIISATSLSGVYQSPDMAMFLRNITNDSDLVDTIGHSIFIYHHK